jgi:ABC-type transport system involved in multi-copper enzyme maturation permease subunit
MVGPVLYQEMLLGARRSRWHWFRAIYFGWLMVVMFPWIFFGLLALGAGRPEGADLRDLSYLAENYLGFFLFQHFLLVLLITPVLVAGAITDEKSRGTLQYLLTTDLHPWEILLGKLAARVYQELLLALVGLPLFAFFGVLAGMDAARVLGFILCTIVLVFMAGTFSLLTSVWCRHTRDAVLTVYCVAVAVCVLMPLARFLGDRWAPGLIGSFLDCIYPLNPLGGYTATMPLAEYGRRLVIFTAWWGGLGFVFLAVAGLRLRGAYIRQLEKSGRQKKRHWWNLRRPPVGDHPLLWKERYIEGIAPLALLRRVPTWLGILVIFVATTIASGWILVEHLPYGTTLANVRDMVLHGDWEGLWSVRERLDSNYGDFMWQGWIVLLLASLVIGIRCSGAVTGEREKNSWEALLLTPIETRHLVRGKMWGIAGACVPYLLAYAVPALILAAIGGIPSLLVVLLMLAVTILGIFYVAASGIWWSVRSKSSWRSLLGTLGMTYVGGAALWCVLSGVAWIIAIIILLFIALLEQVIYQRTGQRLGLTTSPATLINSWFIGICLCLAGAFVLLSWLLIRAAEYRVSVLERIKHWKDEPRYGFRPRRRRRYEDEDW